jgi:hypothetical protein
MTQSRNPFAPDYKNPWWFKVADLIPDWVAFIGLAIMAGTFGAILADFIHGLFCCGGCR